MIAATNITNQKISYTDASSFVIMEEKKIKVALTFDEDFIKAGFKKVPQVKIGY